MTGKISQDSRRIQISVIKQQHLRHLYVTNSSEAASGPESKEYLAIHEEVLAV